MTDATTQIVGDVFAKSPQAAIPSSCQQCCRFFHKPSLAKADAKLGPLVSVGKKQMIYEKGQPAHHCYKVVEGAVRVSRLMADGHLEF